MPPPIPTRRAYSQAILNSARVLLICAAKSPDGGYPIAACFSRQSRTALHAAGLGMGLNPVVIRAGHQRVLSLPSVRGKQFQNSKIHTVRHGAESLRKQPINGGKNQLPPPEGAV